MEPAKRNQQRPHLAGGTLHQAMAREVRRVLAEIKDSGVMGMRKAAQTLGVSERVLYKWTGPIEKGGWPELQVGMEEAMAKVSSAVKKKPVKKPAKKSTKKK